MPDNVEKYEDSPEFTEDEATVKKGFGFYPVSMPGDELSALNKLIVALMRQHDHYKGIVTAPVVSATAPANNKNPLGVFIPDTMPIEEVYAYARENSEAAKNKYVAAVYYPADKEGDVGSLAPHFCNTLNGALFACKNQAVWAVAFMGVVHFYGRGNEVIDNRPHPSA